MRKHSVLDRQAICSVNKMTIQFPENPRNRYNPDKTPGFSPPKPTHYSTEQLCKEDGE